MYTLTKPDRLDSTLLSRRQTVLALLGVTGSTLLSACGGGNGESTATSLPLIGSPRVLASPEGDEIVFSATDPSNPLNIFRIPITRRLQVLANELAQGAQSTLHAIDRFITYIDGFAVGFASAVTPDATVQERIGACSSYTSVLLAMARCLGIPGRTISFGNYPVNDGYAACELYINDRWMFFDATAHVHYTSAQTSDAIPLAYDEIKNRYSNSLSIFRVGQNTRSGRDLYSGQDIFLQANPQGIIGPENPLRYPLELNLPIKPTITKKDFTASNQGAIYIGAADTNIQHYWNLTGLHAGKNYRFIMTPDWLGGDLVAPDSTFILSNELLGATYLNSPITQFDFADGSADPYVVEFTALGSSVGLNLSHPYRGPAFRYVHAQGYRLEPI